MNQIELHLDNDTELIVIEDQPHPLEEEINAAAEDGDMNTVMKIFTGLYKEEKINEIENILSRQFFTDKQTATAINKIKEEAEFMT